MVVIAVIPTTTMIIKIISDLVTPIKNSKSRKDNKEKKNKTMIQKQGKRDKEQTKKKNGNARKSENERKSEREILKTDNIPHNISIRFLKYELSKN